MNASTQCNFNLYCKIKDPRKHGKGLCVSHENSKIINVCLLGCCHRYEINLRRKKHKHEIYFNCKKIDEPIVEKVFFE